MRNFARSAVLSSGDTSSYGYVHQFLNAASTLSPSHACKVKSQIPAKHGKHSATSPSFPHHRVTSRSCPFAARCSPSGSVGTINEIKFQASQAAHRKRTVKLLSVPLSGGNLQRITNTCRYAFDATGWIAVPPPVGYGVFLEKVTCKLC